MNKFRLAAATLVIAGSLAACAGNPDQNTFGGKLQSEGGELAKIGKQWSDAEAAIVTGRELIADGEEDIDDGESLISKGKRKIARGESQTREPETAKREAEEAFRLRELNGKGTEAPTKS